MPQEDIYNQPYRRRLTSVKQLLHVCAPPAAANVLPWNRHPDTLFSSPSTSDLGHGLAMNISKSRVHADRNRWEHGSGGRDRKGMYYYERA